MTTDFQVENLRGEISRLRGQTYHLVLQRNSAIGTLLLLTGLALLWFALQTADSTARPWDNRAEILWGVVAVVCGAWWFTLLRRIARS